LDHFRANEELEALPKGEPRLTEGERETVIPEEFGVASKIMNPKSYAHLSRSG
jgi:hypothetical protein